MKSIAVFACLFILAVNNVCFAMVIKLDLHQMVDRSESIVVGEVKTIKRVSTSELCDPTVASVKINEVVKGNADEQRIEVTFCAELSIEPDLREGQRYVFFVGRWKGKNMVVQGYAGAVPIHDSHVSVNYILGEPVLQPLSVFVSRIRLMVNSASCAP
jgi:hypothetical protein